jgi:hypothetical protein
MDKPLRRILGKKEHNQQALVADSSIPKFIIVINCQPAGIVVVLEDGLLAGGLELDLNREIGEDGLRHEPLLDVDSSINTGSVALSARDIASEPSPRRNGMKVGIAEFCLNLPVTQEHESKPPPPEASAPWPGPLQRAPSPARSYGWPREAAPISRQHVQSG